MNTLIETGLFPLLGLGIKRVGSFIGGLIALTIALLFGKRKDMKGSIPNGNLYIGVTAFAVLGTIALAGISFAGSFAAASDYALKNGIDASVAMFIPIAVDGLIVLCVVAIFGSGLGGYSATWLSLMVATFTGLSMYFNISHMPPETWWVDRYLLGGAFPLIVLIATEATSWQIKKAVAFNQTSKTFAELVESVGKLKIDKASAEATIANMAEQAASMQAQIKAYQTTVGNLERDLSILAVSANADEASAETIERKVQIIRIKVDEPKTTQAQLAEILGTSQKTISRDISELSELTFIKSGNGRAK